MSYSLMHPCNDCTKKDRCNDRHFIQGAICGIHDVSPGAEKGHLGAGHVDLVCYNKEQAEA